MGYPNILLDTHVHTLYCVHMVHTLQSKSNGSEVDLQRQERIVVRISTLERRMFEKAAKSRFTNLSELIRQLLHREVEEQTQKG